MQSTLSSQIVSNLILLSFDSVRKIVYNQPRIYDFLEGVPTYYLVKISLKLYENEENWTEKRVWRGVQILLCRSAAGNY